MNELIRLSEVFAPTVQGEGPHAGQRVGFIRFAECNLACSWCDTPYSWDWQRFDRAKESHLVTLEELVGVVRSMPVSRVVLTGGEPLMQQRFFAGLRAHTSVQYDVETNGTIVPHPSIVPGIDLFVVSPKLSSAGNPSRMAVKRPAMMAFAALARRDRAAFKWVVKDEDDIAEAMRLTSEYGIPLEATWLMPEGITREEHLESLERLADSIVATGANLSTRLHVLAWGDRRGV